uniref:SAP domain-containing protein n=1 Tax=viral metagenome TaxID=1070528 RepID=A0A6C0IVY7_9ZZZZ
MVNTSTIIIVALIFLTFVVNYLEIKKNNSILYELIDNIKELRTISYPKKNYIQNKEPLVQNHIVQKPINVTKKEEIENVLNYEVSSNDTKEIEEEIRQYEEELKKLDNNNNDIISNSSVSLNNNNDIISNSSVSLDNIREQINNLDHNKTELVNSEKNSLTSESEISNINNNQNISKFKTNNLENNQNQSDIKLDNFSNNQSETELDNISNNQSDTELDNNQNQSGTEVNNLEESQISDTEADKSSNNKNQSGTEIDNLEESQISDTEADKSNNNQTELDITDLDSKIENYLKKYTLKDLKQVCRTNSISVRGTKQLLITKLLDNNILL